MPRSVASDLGLHCLPMSLLQNARHKWVKFHFQYVNKTPKEAEILELFIMDLLTFLTGVMRELIVYNRLATREDPNQFPWNPLSRAKRVANEVTSTIREYDQGKVIYNDIYFQQKSLWAIFFLLLPGSCHRKLQNWLGRTWLYHYSRSDKKRVSISVTNIFCWLFLLFIINLHIFFYILIFILNDAVKDFWRDYRQVCAVLAFRLSLFSYYPLTLEKCHLLFFFIYRN